MSTYLAELTVKLASGLGKLPEETRGRHAAYFKRRQRDDGGFAGREGESDLYYTGFALRALAVLGELYGDVAERAASFLRGKLSGHESIIDFFSLIYSASLVQVSAGIDVFAKADSGWREQVAATMDRLRRDDGGFAKTMEGQASSTYQSFLVVLCLQLIERPIPDPEGIVRFLQTQQNAEGGFREIRASKRAGTNPSAAAIATLKILDALDEETIQDNIDFLCDMQSAEGGLQANTRIPFADLLSTFTGLLTLDDLLAAEELDLRRLHHFAVKLQHADGGFRAGNFDEAVDVEYSFYGLGTLALLAHYGVGVE